MGLSENSVPLHPMVNDHYPVFKWLFHWGYTPLSDIPILQSDGQLLDIKPAVFQNQGIPSCPVLPLWVPPGCAGAGFIILNCVLQLAMRWLTSGNLT